MERYQGIVALEGGSLEDVAHTYFQQSEQVPTLVRLAVAQLSRKGDTQPHWRAGGVLVQYLPPHGAADDARPAGRRRFRQSRDRRPGLSPRATNGPRRARCSARSPMTSWPIPDVSAERLLFRLFHETGVRVFDADARSRSAAPARPSASKPCCATISRAEERADMVVDGEIEVVCEFCSADYHFKPHEFDGDDEALDVLAVPAPAGLSYQADHDRRELADLPFFHLFNVGAARFRPRLGRWADLEQEKIDVTRATPVAATQSRGGKAAPRCAALAAARPVADRHRRRARHRRPVLSLRQHHARASASAAAAARSPLVAARRRPQGRHG